MNISFKLIHLFCMFNLRIIFFRMNGISSNEEMRDRYQRASDHFCHTQLDLPTPVTMNNNNNNLSKAKNQSWSSSSSTNSTSFLDQTRNTRTSQSSTKDCLPKETFFFFSLFSGLSNTAESPTSN